MMTRILLLLVALLSLGAEPRVDRYGDPLPPGAVARLGTVRFHHPGHVQRLALSPDRRSIAASGERILVLWDAATGRERWRIEGVFSRLDFLADGERLVAMRENGKIVLIATATGKVLSETTAPPQVLFSSLIVTADYKTLAVGTKDDVYLFDAESGRESGRIVVAGASPEELAIAPDGKHLAMSVCQTDKKHAVVLWDLVAKKEVSRLVGDSVIARSLVFSPDGATLATVASADDGSQLRLWDVASGEERVQLALVEGYCIDLVFSPDGKFLATTTVTVSQPPFRPCVRLWQADSGGNLGLLDHVVSTNALVFAPEGKSLAIGSWQTIRRFDVASQTQIDPPEAHHSMIVSAGWSPDGRVIATGSSDRTIRLWDAVTGQQLSVGACVEKIDLLSLSPDGCTAVVVVDERDPVRTPIRVVDIVAREELLRFDCDRWEVRAVSFTPNGKSFAVVGAGNTLTVRETNTGKLQHTIRVEPGPPKVFRLDDTIFSPNGRYVTALVSDAFGDATRLSVWDTTTWRELPLADVPHTGKYRLRAIAFAPDGRTIAALVVLPDQSDRVYFWELATGQVRHTITTRASYANEMQFSPDGRLLAIAVRKEIQLWDVATGKEVGCLTGHQGEVTRSAFSPDGRRLLTIGHDPWALIWDVADLTKREK